MVSRTARFGAVRFPVIALVVAVLLGGCTAGPRSARPEGSVTPVTSAGVTSVSVDAGRACTFRALGVLDRWDRARAAAYAVGDAARLRRLYTARSAAGAADVRMLRQYAARGLRVTRMRRQVLDARGRTCTAERLRVRVTDRLDRARVVGAGVARTLPGTGVRRWLLTFAAPDGRWVLATVVAR